MINPQFYVFLKGKSSPRFSSIPTSMKTLQLVQLKLQPNEKLDNREISIT